MYKYLLGVFVMLISYCSYSQVELSKETTKKEKKKKSIESDKELSSTSVFVITNWSSTSRKLIENKGLFGDSLGERSNETSLNLWSFGIGLRTQIHEYIAWEGGINYTKNGEQYKYDETDSMYNYQSRYSYLSMPIKVYFTYGEKWKLLAGVGIVPQMFVGYEKNEQWRDAEGNEDESSSKLKIGYNSFVFSTVFNVGVQYQISKRIGVLLMPEYKMQLSTSYLKTSSYKHFGRSLGGNVGLIINL